MGLDLARHVDAGRIVLTHRLIDLPVDQALSELWQAIEPPLRKRLVMDSITEVDQAILDERRRHRVPQALARALRAQGVTGVLLRETRPFAENILHLRYANFDGRFHRVLSVLKMRDSAHDRSLRQYEVTGRGFQVLARSESAAGLLAVIQGAPQGGE